MSFTPWKLDGFEHGRVVVSAVGVWDQIGGAPAIVTTPVRTGLRSLEITAAAAAERATYLPAAGVRYATMSFYIRFAALPGANCQLASWTNANGSGQVRWNFTTSRIVCSINNIGNTDVPVAITTNTWYLVDAIFDARTGTASMKVSVDESAAITVNRAQTAADITALSLGTVAAETLTAYYDDWAISVTADDTVLGHHQIESLIPNADGTHSITTSGDFDSFTTTAFSNATTTGNTFIGHRPLQAANTANQVIRHELGTTANYMEFGLEDVSVGAAAPVLAVRAYATHVESSATGASSGEARLLLSDNTEVLTTGSISVINSTEDPGTTVTIRSRMCIDPSGGWDVTKINGCKARVGFGDNDPDVNFIDFMLEVLIVGSVQATPAKVSSVAAVATPAMAITSTPTPAKVSSLAAVATPIVAISVAPAPSAVAAVAAVATPGILRTATATPSAVTGVAALPAPSTLAAAVATPSKVDSVAAVATPAVVITANATATPSVVPTVAAVATPTAHGNAGATPGAVKGWSRIPSGSGALPAWIAVGTTVEATDNIVLPLPPGWAENDQLVAIIESNAIEMSGPSTPPAAGWRGGSVVPTTDSTVQLNIYYKEATPYEADPTFGVDGVADHLVGFIVALRGVRGSVDPDTPWDVTSFGVEDTSDTSAVIPGATTTLPNTLVLIIEGFTGTPQTGWANADLANVTHRADAQTAVGAGGSVAVATGEKVTAGAYGNTTLTHATATKKAFITYAFAPAPKIASSTAIATPAVVPAVVAVPTPTAAVYATGLPSTIAAVTAVPAPSITSTAAATPAVVPAIAGVPTPAVMRTAVATPAVVPAVTALPAPSAHGNADAAPVKVSSLAALPTPTVVAIAAATPTKVSAIAALTTPAVLAAANATPAKVSSLAAVPTPNVVTGTAATPSVVAALAALASPAIRADALVLAAVVAATAALPAPSARANANATPAVIACLAAVPTPTVVAITLALVPVVAATVALPAPTTTADARAPPSVVVGAVAVPAPVTRADALAPAVAVAAIASVPAPSVVITVNAQALPSVVIALAALATPNVVGTAVATPLNIAATTIVSGTAAASALAIVTVIPAVAAVPQAVGNTDTHANATPQPVAGEAALPLATVTADAVATPLVIQANTAFPSSRVPHAEWPGGVGTEWDAETGPEWAVTNSPAWVGSTGTEWPQSSDDEWGTQ